jgi:hypothetical protein
MDVERKETIDNAQSTFLTNNKHLLLVNAFDVDVVNRNAPSSPDLPYEPGIKSLCFLGAKSPFGSGLPRVVYHQKKNFTYTSYVLHSLM